MLKFPRFGHKWVLYCVFFYCACAKWLYWSCYCKVRSSNWWVVCRPTKYLSLTIVWLVGASLLTACLRLQWIEKSGTGISLIQKVSIKQYSSPSCVILQIILLLRTNFSTLTTSSFRGYLISLHQLERLPSVANILRFGWTPIVANFAASHTCLNDAISLLGSHPIVRSGLNMSVLGIPSTDRKSGRIGPPK